MCVMSSDRISTAYIALHLRVPARMYVSDAWYPSNQSKNVDGSLLHLMELLTPVYIESVPDFLPRGSLVSVKEVDSSINRSPRP